jgi:hypothetical protein
MWGVFPPSTSFPLQVLIPSNAPYSLIILPTGTVQSLMTASLNTSVRVILNYLSLWLIPRVWTCNKNPDFIDVNWGKVGRREKRAFELFILLLVHFSHLFSL